MITSLFLSLLTSQLKHEIKVDLDQTYTVVDGKPLKYDFYHADSPHTSAEPLVVLIHGGAWSAGDKSGMGQIAKMFAEKGVNVASINYRLSPKYKWPAHIDDCQTAMRYFRANGRKMGFDTNRIGVGGASAGAHIALLIGLNETRDMHAKENSKVSSQAAVVLNFFAPVDLSQDFPTNLADSLTKSVIGKPFKEAQKEIAEFSPINFVKKGSVPVFTIHGASDSLVPPIQAKRLDNKLTEVGVEHVTRMIPNMGHEFRWTSPEFVAAVNEGIDFVKSRIGG